MCKNKSKTLFCLSPKISDTTKTPTHPTHLVPLFSHLPHHSWFLCLFPPPRIKPETPYNPLALELGFKGFHDRGFFTTGNESDAEYLRFKLREMIHYVLIQVSFSFFPSYYLRMEIQVWNYQKMSTSEVISLQTNPRVHPKWDRHIRCFLSIWQK